MLLNMSGKTGGQAGADPFAVRTMMSCSHHEWAGGHDSFWWERTLPDALAWLLS